MLRRICNRFPLTDAAALAVMLITLACSPPAAGNNSTADSERAHGSHMQYLDAAHRTVTTDLDADRPAAPAKFVIVEIATVANRRKIPLDFIVGYRPPGGLELRLGTFSLFPPDNPGRFIVATQGKVKRGGTLSLSLDEITPKDIGDVRIGVRAIYLGER